ncbi:unnamed protein product, partial [Meganyctiphanes norvegica]
KCCASGFCKWWTTCCAVLTTVGLCLSMTPGSPVEVTAAPSSGSMGISLIVLKIMYLMGSVIMTTLFVWGNHWEKPNLLKIYCWLGISTFLPGLYFIYMSGNVFFNFIFIFKIINVFVVACRYMHMSKLNSMDKVLIILSFLIIFSCLPLVISLYHIGIISREGPSCTHYWSRPPTNCSSTFQPGRG